MNKENELINKVFHNLKDEDFTTRKYWISSVWLGTIKINGECFKGTPHEIIAHLISNGERIEDILKVSFEKMRVIELK